MNSVVAVMLLAMLEFIVFGFMVGKARGKYGVPAPAIAGNENFERYFRVQQNTLELLVVFLPACWFFATLVSANWAAILGLIFVAGRIVYAAGYIKAASKRGAGYGLSFLPMIALLFGALYGAIKSAIMAG